ncbi:LPXTG cell wall anchor domain-containing protein, partial [Gemella parahaemolysans]
LSSVRYEKDSTREKGQNNITIPGEKGTRKVTTTYEVNPKTGEITERVGTPEVTDATETVVKVAAKDKVEVTELLSSVRYEKDSTREKGQNNITIPGEKGTRKVTTTYEVNPKTGEVTERVGTPEVTDATETVVKVAAKDKVEVVQREDGKKVKVTTVYIVDEKTGNITQTKREEEISHDVVTSKSDEKVPTVELEAFEGGVNPSESVVTEELKAFEGGVNPSESVVTEEPKAFEGGVNPSESVVTEELKPFAGGVNAEISVVKEELPELKVALLKDEEDNVLEVLAISEKPKELKGYKYTGKEKVDGEGNKIYIYEKDKSKVVTSKSDEKVPTVELKAFEGGVNPSESVVTEELKPFAGGVNPSESIVTEELKPFAGGVNPSESVVTEELKPFEGGVNPSESVVTEELKAFVGGVNAETATVKEQLPELKVALLKDEEGNILDVLAISEKLKELKGYKYTGKEEVDGEGNKIYIYQKVELENHDNEKQETVDVNQSQNTESQNETAESKKAQVKKLPNTGETPVESGILGVMLLAATTMLSKRKLKK